MYIDFDNYRDLEISTIETRRNCLQQIVGMIPYQPGAASELFGRITDFAGADIFNRFEDGSRKFSIDFERYKQNGQMTPEQTTDLLISTPLRLKKFANAIVTAKFPSGSPIIDIGTGPAAILALVSAVAHPESKITAYEIDVRAAGIARKLVELFAVDDQITIVCADFREIPPQGAGLVTTETFAPGLCNEYGTDLLARAAKGGVDAMIPDTIETFAKIGDDEWQKSAVIDLRNFDGQISGTVTPRTGVLYVRGDYYTEFGSKPVITGEDSDVICGKAMICNVKQEVDEINGLYRYSYPVGFTPDTGNLDGLDIKFIPK